MGVRTYVEKVQYFNDLGLRGFDNPWERISAFTGAALALEFPGRPVLAQSRL